MGRLRYNNVQTYRPLDRSGPGPITTLSLSLSPSLSLSLSLSLSVSALDRQRAPHSPTEKMAWKGKKKQVVQQNLCPELLEFS